MAGYTWSNTSSRDALGHDVWARGQATKDQQVGKWKYVNANDKNYHWWGENKNESNKRAKGYSNAQRIAQWVDRYFDPSRTNDDIKTRWGAGLTYEQAYDKGVQMLREKFRKDGVDWAKSGFAEVTDQGSNPATAAGRPDPSTYYQPGQTDMPKETRTGTGSAPSTGAAPAAASTGGTIRQDGVDGRGNPQYLDEQGEVVTFDDPRYDRIASLYKAQQSQTARDRAPAPGAPSTQSTSTGTTGGGGTVSVPRVDPVGSGLDPANGAQRQTSVAAAQAATGTPAAGNRAAADLRDDSLFNPGQAIDASFGQSNWRRGNDPWYSFFADRMSTLAPYLAITRGYDPQDVAGTQKMFRDVSGSYLGNGGGAAPVTIQEMRQAMQALQNNPKGDLAMSILGDLDTQGNFTRDADTQFKQLGGMLQGFAGLTMNPLLAKAMLEGLNYTRGEFANKPSSDQRNILEWLKQTGWMDRWFNNR